MFFGFKACYLFDGAALHALVLDRAADGDGGDEDDQSREGALKTGNSHRMAAAVVLVLCVVLGAHALVWRIAKTRAFVAGHV